MMFKNHFSLHTQIDAQTDIQTDTRKPVSSQQRHTQTKLFKGLNLSEIYRPTWLLRILTD